MSTGPYRSEASSFYKNKWGVAGPHRVRGLHKYDSDARRLAEELNAAYAQGQADAQRWIPVTETLPPIHEDADDERGYVLIIFQHDRWPGGGYRTKKASRVMDEDGWVWADEDGEQIDDDDNLITHWMPIPPRP